MFLGGISGAILWFVAGPVLVLPVLGLFALLTVWRVTWDVVESLKQPVAFKFVGKYLEVKWRNRTRQFRLDSLEIVDTYGFVPSDVGAAFVFRAEGTTIKVLPQITRHNELHDLVQEAERQAKGRHALGRSDA